MRRLAPEFEVLEPRGANIKYSNEALEYDLDRVRSVWSSVQTMRQRGAIHCYLRAVFDLVALWHLEGRAESRALRAMGLSGIDLAKSADVYSAVLASTSSVATNDRRTRSKWARVLRYAEDAKPDSEPLEVFIHRKKGINACASRAARRRRQ
jgi:hypothetical protein